MRLLLDLKANHTLKYKNRYHHKLRGRLWRALEETPYAELHDDPEAFPFCYSNIFPRADFSEGEEAHLLVSSNHEGLVRLLSDNLDKNREFNIGDMPFEITGIREVSPTVGQLGTTGRIRCHTGVYIPLFPDHREAFNIGDEYDAERISWVKEHGVELLKQRLVYDANRKIERFFQQEEAVEEFSDLFASVSFGNTHPLELQVSEQHSRMFVPTEMTFGYRIQHPDQRDYLNLLLNTGIGWRNSLGFGFANIIEQEDI